MSEGVVTTPAPTRPVGTVGQRLIKSMRSKSSNSKISFLLRVGSRFRLPSHAAAACSQRMGNGNHDGFLLHSDQRLRRHMQYYLTMTATCCGLAADNISLPLRYALLSTAAPCAAVGASPTGINSGESTCAIPTETPHHSRMGGRTVTGRAGRYPLLDLGILSYRNGR